MSDPDWSGYRVAAWAGIAALTLAVLVALLQGKPGGALTLACFLSASIAFLLLASQLPNLFDFLFVLAGLLNAAGFVWELFQAPGPYDEVAHTFTSFSITLALGYLVYGARLISFRGQYALIVLTIASFGIALGALWEIAEWLADLVLSAQVIESLDDSISDLILDSLGAGLAALLTLRVVHQASHAEPDSQPAAEAAPPRGEAGTRKQA